MIWVLSILSSLFLAQATDPPPLPDPAPAVTTKKKATQETSPIYDRYQECIQRLIDQKNPNQTFMRTCLGLGQKIKKSRKKISSNDPEKMRVLEVVNREMANLFPCYDEQVAKLKGLGLVPQGRVIIDFDLTGDGRVDHFGFSSATFSDLNFLNCLKDKVLVWRFTPGLSTETLRVQLALGFKHDKSGVDISVMEGFPKVKQAAWTFSSGAMIAVFQKYASDVRSCYDGLLQRKPQARGKVAVDVTVDKVGKVLTVFFREMSLDDVNFQACLNYSIKNWQFPKPQTGKDTVARYPPWIFEPPQVNAQDL